MILGMSLSTFTLLHVLISLAGIGTGFIVVYGMLDGRRLEGWTGIFLVTTVLTSATGFLFPVEHLLPSHIVGTISLVVLAVAQAFLKIPALHALAPNGKEPPLVAAQVVVRAIFIGLGMVAAKRFRAQVATA
jgi:hypothetical protein